MSKKHKFKKKTIYILTISQLTKGSGVHPTPDFYCPFTMNAKLIFGIRKKRSRTFGGKWSLPLKARE